MRCADRLWRAAADPQIYPLKDNFMFTDRKIKAAAISIAVDMILVEIKLFGVAVSHSRSLHADALHSFSDICVSSLVMLSVLGAQRFHKWSRVFEEGAAFLIGLIITWVAVGVLRASNELVADGALKNLPLVIVLTWACILITYFASQYKLRVGRECNAVNLQADGRHTRMDMYSSVVVLLGLVGSWSGFRLDGVASVVVGILILRLGLLVLMAAVQNLLKPGIPIFEAVGQFELAKIGALFFTAVCNWMGINLTHWARRANALGFYVKNHKGGLAALILSLMSLHYIASGLYIIGPDERGVVTEFGKLKTEADFPGLHYRFPPPFSRLYRAKPEQIYQVELGFRTVGQRGVASEPDVYLWESQHAAGLFEKRIDEAIMLTGDKNEVDLNFVIEYRLSEKSLSHYLFSAADPALIIRTLAQECIRGVAGGMELTEVLTTSRHDVEERVVANLQPVLDSMQLGVCLVAARLQDVHPPAQVVPAFRAVAAAREERATIIHKAEAYKNETLPNARGGAVILHDDAAAYVDEKRLNALGETAYFNKLASSHQSNPEAVCFLQHALTLEKVLPGLRIFLFDKKILEGPEAERLPAYFLGAEFFKGIPGKTSLRKAERNETSSILNQLESSMGAGIVPTESRDYSNTDDEQRFTAINDAEEDDGEAWEEEWDEDKE